MMPGINLHVSVYIKEHYNTFDCMLKKPLVLEEETPNLIRKVIEKQDCSVHTDKWLYSIFLTIISFFMALIPSSAIIYYEFFRRKTSTT